jgi:hypothetical protein
MPTDLLAPTSSIDAGRRTEVVLDRSKTFAPSGAGKARSLKSSILIMHPNVVIMTLEMILAMVAFLMHETPGYSQIKAHKYRSDQDTLIRYVPLGAASRPSEA